MNKTRYFVLVVIMFLFLYPIRTVAADFSDSVALINSDEEGTNYYSFASGSFESNLTDGATEEVGYFNWDEKLNISLLLDGNQISYIKNDIIYQNGNYVAIIYDLENGNMTSMKFTIKNALNASSPAETAMEMDNEDIEFFQNMNDISLSSNGFYGIEGLDALQSMYSDDINNKEASRLSISYKYDTDSDRFIYGAAGRELYITDIPNNAISNMPVMVKAANDAYIFVYKDGELTFTSSDNRYSEPGFYDVISYIFANDDEQIPEDERAVDSNAYECHFVFRIIPQDVNNLGVINPPENFVFESINYNGEAVSIPENNYFFLEGDGNYNFVFKSKSAYGLPDLTYNLEFQLDTVAPFIHFNQPIINQRGRAPISYELSEIDANVVLSTGSVSFNMAPGEESNYSGWYHFSVSDRAGNTRNYAVYIKEQFRFFSRGMIILLFSILLVFIIYILSIRRGSYQVNEIIKTEDEVEDDI